MRSCDASGMTAEALRSRDAAVRAGSGRELAGLHRASHECGDGMQSAAGVAAERRKQGGAVLARAIVTAIAERRARLADDAPLPAASTVTPVRS